MFVNRRFNNAILYRGAIWRKLSNKQHCSITAFCTNDNAE